MHSILSLVVSLSVLSVAMPAWAGDTFFVDSVNGNDANTCRSAAQACLTIAQAKSLVINQTKPQNSTIKLSGTFSELLSFDDGDVSDGKLLDGLRITATNTDAKPTIDGTGFDYAISITEINDVTVDHIIATGAPDGIYVGGSTANYITNANIHHNTVTGLVGDPSFTGIYLSSAKQSTVSHNRVADISTTVVDSSSYTSSRGIYLYRLRSSTIKDNIITNLTYSNTLTAANSVYMYLYGISGSQLIDTKLNQNEVSQLTATHTATAASVTMSSTIYGISISTALNFTAKQNSVQTISGVGSSALASTTANSTVYGMVLTDIHAGDGENVVQKNRVEALTVTAQAVSNSARISGVEISSAHMISVKKNRILDLQGTAGSTEANGNHSVYIYGMYGPNYSTDVTMKQNTVGDLVSTVNYSGADSQSYSYVRGISSGYSTVSILDNTVRDLSTTVNNNNAASPYDYNYVVGVDVYQAPQVALEQNTVKTIQNTNVTSSVGANLTNYSYGISLNGIGTAVVKQNTIRGLAGTLQNSDPTGASVGYSYLYLLSLYNVSDLVATNNTLTDSSSAIGGGDANASYHYVHGINLNSSEGTVSRNAVTAIDLTATGNTGTTYQTIYFYYINSLGQVVIDNNSVKQITTSNSATASTHNVYGYYVANAKPLYMNSNEFRNVATTAISQTVVGIYFSTDASGSRLFNNVILGKESYNDDQTYVGLQLVSDSTNDLDVINNTLVDWVYPVRIDGGENIKLLNNILAAITDAGYAMAIAYEHVNLDQFKSDYNLLYNNLGKAQALYNLDTSSAIHFGDWSNQNGSYGYDVHSRYAKPKVTSSGRLKASSKARNHGSSTFGYSSDSLESTLISTDVNGDQRAADAKVDIGADEL